MKAPEQNGPVSVDPNRLRLTNDAGTEGVLLGVRCRQCGIYLFGSATFCQACSADDLKPTDLSRRGTLYSYTVVRVPPAGWPGPVPYILGEVALPEGPHVLAEVIDCQESALKIGVQVELALQAVLDKDSTESPVVYKWRLAAKGG